MSPVLNGPFWYQEPLTFLNIDINHFTLARGVFGRTLWANTNVTVGVFCGCSRSLMHHNSAWMSSTVVCQSFTSNSGDWKVWAKEIHKSTRKKNNQARCHIKQIVFIQRRLSIYLSVYQHTCNFNIKIHSNLTLLFEFPIFHRGIHSSVNVFIYWTGIRSFFAITITHLHLSLWSPPSVPERWWSGKKESPLVSASVTIFFFFQTSRSSSANTKTKHFLNNFVRPQTREHLSASIHHHLSLIRSGLYKPIMVGSLVQFVVKLETSEGFKIDSRKRW